MAIWINEPPRWSEESGSLTLETAHGCDFWRRTQYGFIRDDGHFRAHEVSGDFSATVEVEGRYETLYDQAGLMVRVDEERWMKCGIEFFEDRQFASVVVTREYSDWSVTPVPGLPDRMRFRVTRSGDTLEIFWSRPGEPWTMMRTAYLPMGATVKVGPMAASPERAGFVARFLDFRIEQG
jgi:regulation of enolase protein 1 (concanavalin A-like superfamily)